MFLSADQPLVTSSLINSLLYRFWSSDKDICIPVAGERKGPPTIFSRRYFPALFDVVGDKGGRDVIGAAADNVLAVELEDPTWLMDIDTPADLEALKARIAQAYDLDTTSTN
jgi:molybdenum cofactor cytidylyltransferase